MSLSHFQFDTNRSAPAQSRSALKLRIFSIALATVLCLQAIWILAPEFYRPPLPFFPTTRNEVDEFSNARAAAADAARLGWIRGDLWVDYALAADALFLGRISDSASHIGEENSEIAEHAATLAPYDARAWLLLSNLNFVVGAKVENAVAQLKMSFYTAPNDSRLVPLRISLAARLPFIDEETQNLLEHDLRLAALHKPNLNSAIVTAYNNGSSVGREIIGKRLADIDPRFWAELVTRLDKHENIHRP